VAKKSWPTVVVNRDNHTRVEAIAPTVISASRSTDIPAFYGDWLMARLKKGYVRWNNPFNGKALYISFCNTRCFVFWTKNPEPFLDNIHVLNTFPFTYYFLFTLNDYEKEGLEPGLSSLDKRVETFRILSEKIGAHRVLWRFDPILLCDTLCLDELVERIGRVAHSLKGYSKKLIFSFVEIEKYTKVQKNLRRYQKNVRELTVSEKRQILSALSQLQQELGFHCATCAIEEDYSSFGISHSKCVDEDLIADLLGLSDVSELYPHLFSEQQQELFKTNVSRRIRDRGQRKQCGCALSKDIGQYDTCAHRCRYCYANSSSDDILLKRVAGNSAGSESIL